MADSPPSPSTKLNEGDVPADHTPAQANSIPTSKQILEHETAEVVVPEDVTNAASPSPTNDLAGDTSQVGGIVPKGSVSGDEQLSLAALCDWFYSLSFCL